MAYSLTWLPVVLRRAGLKVAETQDWQNRGLGEMGRILGVICHHTVGAATGNMPSLNVLVRGRQGRNPLTGPLAHLGLGRDGTFYVVAAGKAQHAGPGVWQGQVNGNTNFIGIEAENAGTDADRWPEVQMDAWVRGVAAILRHAGAPASMCCGHKEWNPVRKPHCPHVNMVAFRRSVAAAMDGTAATRPIVPASLRVDAATVLPTLRRGMTSEHVKAVKQKLGMDAASGEFDAVTEAKVRQFQRNNLDADGKPLVADGIVGPKTWVALGFGPRPATAPAASAAPASAEASARQ